MSSTRLRASHLCLQVVWVLKIKPLSFHADGDTDTPLSACLSCCCYYFVLQLDDEESTITLLIPVKKA